MLRQPCVQEQPTLHDRGEADRHPAAAAASVLHGLLLPEDEVHHRGGIPAALRQERGLQRKVRPGPHEPLPTATVASSRSNNPQSMIRSEQVKPKVDLSLSHTRLSCPPVKRV